MGGGLRLDFSLPLGHRIAVLCPTNPHINHMNSTFAGRKAEKQSTAAAVCTYYAHMDCACKIPDISPPMGRVFRVFTPMLPPCSPQTGVGVGHTMHKSALFTCDSVCMLATNPCISIIRVCPARLLIKRVCKVIHHLHRLHYEICIKDKLLSVENLKYSPFTRQ